MIKNHKNAWKLQNFGRNLQTPILLQYFKKKIPEINRNKGAVEAVQAGFIALATTTPSFIPYTYYFNHQTCNFSLKLFFFSFSLFFHTKSSATLYFACSSCVTILFLLWNCVFMVRNRFGVMWNGCMLITSWPLKYKWIGTICAVEGKEVDALRALPVNK